MRVFENRVLRRIFGPKWNEIAGGWSKLHKEELRDLNYSSCMIRITNLRRKKWAGHVARTGEKRKSYRLLVSKPEGKRPLARTRRRWVAKVKIDLVGIKWGSLDWIVLAQDLYIYVCVCVCLCVYVYRIIKA
jgi:hypothetical protein